MYKKLKKHIIFLFMLTIFSLFGCSMPKIIILEDPLTPEEHIALGISYEKKGLFDEAIKEYKAAANKSNDAYFYLGNAYFLKNDFSSAEKNYKKAIKKNPEHADAYNNLAWLYYLKRENLQEAEALAQRAFQLNPDKKDIYIDTLNRIKELK